MTRKNGVKPSGFKVIETIRFFYFNIFYKNKENVGKGFTSYDFDTRIQINSQENMIGGENIIQFVIAGTVVVLITAAVFDVRCAKIPNFLLIILIGVQIGSEIISILVFKTPIVMGLDIYKKIGFSVVLILFLYPFFQIGKLGAGDVKLIAVSALSVSRPLEYVLSIFVISAVAGIMKILYSKIKKESGKRKVVHLAVPVLCAYLLAVVFCM